MSSRGLDSGGALLKVAVSGSEDRLEQEADRVADQVTNAPLSISEPPRIPVANAIAPQRQCTSCEGVRKLDRNQTGGPRGAPAIVDDVLRTSGEPLDATTRAFMEPRFGHDFGRVRVHTDQRAARSASALSALAYTWGNNIVFGAGQHRPETKEGRQLVAHELAHVVQQAQQPAGMIRRQPSKDDEDKKKQRVAHHERQQRLVVGFLADALKIIPKPAKGPLDPNNLDADTLFHNTAQLVDPPTTAKASLKVLTPTHYSTHDAPVYFDDRFAHPQIQGDYPADPHQQDTGIVIPRNAGEAGITDVQKQSGAGATPSTPQKEEHAPSRVDPRHPFDQSPDAPAKPTPPASTPSAPATARPQFSPAEIKLFLGGGDGTDASDVSLGDFKHILVHEGQHVADWVFLTRATLGDWKSMLETYKSEFRAFWIQPPVPPPPPPFPGAPTIGMPSGLGDFGKTTPVKKGDQISVKLPSGQGCDACGGSSGTGKGTSSAPTEQLTDMQNERQKAIFSYLLNNYSQDRFDCFYVCNREFRDAVNAYGATPIGGSVPNLAGINLVNSPRLIDLNIAVQTLTPGMTGAEVATTNLQSAIEQLDALDWAFLKNGKLSEPFWTSLKGFAPSPLIVAIQDLAKKGAPSAAEIRKALAKLK